MSKKISIIIILFLLLVQISSAIVTPQPQPIPQPMPDPNAVTSLDQVQNTVVQEGTKTRAEITAYTDRKISELVQTVRTDGQKFIDDNFRVLDQRMQELATKFLIKITIGIVVAIVMGLCIWYSIYHYINKLISKRPKTLSQDEFSLQRAGLITPEFAEKIERESKTKYSVPPSPEYRDPQPKPPSIGQIEAMIQLKRKAEEKQGLMKEKQKKAEAYEKKAKKILPKIEKLSEPVPTNTLFNPEFARKSRQKKIEKLQKELEPSRQELNQVLSKEAELDKAIMELQSQSEDFQKLMMTPPPIPPPIFRKRNVELPPEPPKFNEVK